MTDSMLRNIGEELVKTHAVSERDPRRGSRRMVFGSGVKRATEETRRMFRPGGGAPPFGIPVAGLAEKLLDLEDSRLWRVKGAVTAALGQDRGVVLISSLESDVQTGPIAAGLASALMLSERRPLALVDLEYPDHTLQKLLGYESDAGLSEVLRGRLGLGEVVVSARDPRIGFLVAGSKRPGLWEMGSLKAAETFTELVQIYDLMIAALPAGDEGTTEVVSAAASAIGLNVYVLALTGGEDAEQVMSFTEMVTLAGAKVLGWIVT